MREYSHSSLASVMYFKCVINKTLLNIYFVLISFIQRRYSLLSSRLTVLMPLVALNDACVLVQLYTYSARRTLSLASFGITLTQLSLPKKMKFSHH